MIPIPSMELLPLCSLVFQPFLVYLSPINDPACRARLHTNVVTKFRSCEESNIIQTKDLVLNTFVCKSCVINVVSAAGFMGNKLLEPIGDKRIGDSDRRPDTINDRTIRGV